MSQDILIQVDDSGLYDIQIDGADLASSGGFESAIPVSLFSDARVGPQTVQNAIDRRGWVGNILFADIQRQLGSILWTLDQARLTDETINQARVAAREALQWFIDDGLVLSVDVDVVQESNRQINILITFRELDNTIKRYVALWRATDGSKLPTI